MNLLYRENHNIIDDIDFDYDECLPDEKSLDELLTEHDMTFSQALKSAQKYITDYNDRLNELNLSGLSKAALWAELIRSCKEEMTDQKRGLLCTLLIDGWLLRGDLSDSKSIVSSYLISSQHEKELAAALKIRKEKTSEFEEILKTVSAAKQPRSIPEPEDDFFCEALTLLSLEKYCQRDLQSEILKKNVYNIQYIISTIPELTKIAPLVYFRIFCSNNSKLYEKPDYIPTLKNLFLYKEYSLIDNGKNFKKNTQYIELYMDLKELIPESDKELCDAGFLACSNLADWCCEQFRICDSMPFTNRAIVDYFVPGIYDDPFEDDPFWHDKNISIIQLWEWQNKYSLLDSQTERLTSTIKFAALDEFVSDTSRYCDKLLKSSNIADHIQPKMLNIFRALLMHQIEIKFNELLAGEIANLISK